MSRKRHLVKTIKHTLPRISRNFISAIKKKLVWLLRTLFVTKRRPNSANAGFVLPTVAMVSIVVVLLTTAIIFRSFDRAQNASNVRVNSAVLSAATPAIDRGRAKLNKLFQDRRLPRSTPTDEALENLLKGNLTEYTFGDEKSLTLEVYYDQNSAKQTIADPNLQPKTAWKFPIDTDNNGKFDSYTVYGIFFKTPPAGANNKYARARNTLEARTPPMSQGSLNTSCGGDSSATLIGNTGWVQQNNKLKKSFFVYTATVPITDPQSDTTIAAGDLDKYEPYKGNQSFAGLEYQQDRVQIPPNNTAVVYEDDLALTPGADFRLNGAIFTNSNFLTSGQNGGKIRFYQVSSKDSCFYEASNSTITVGSNLARGGFTSDTHSNTNIPDIDLYQGKTANPTTTKFTNSVTNAPRDIAYNNLAYEDRIEKLVNAQFNNSVTSDPSEVEDGIAKRKKSLGLQTFTQEESDKIRKQELKSYFKTRTRRVPFAEVAFNTTESSPSPLLQGSGNSLRPNDRWIYPTDPIDGKTGTNYTKLSLNITGASLEPQATEPIALKENGGKEAVLGDRVVVGNNLPQLWWDKDKQRFVGPNFEDTQKISGVTWNLPAGAETRTRRSTVQTLADLGTADRDGVWELDAAKVPQPITEPVGGLRVVTGAGIYYNAGATPNWSNSIEEIWPDTKPVPGTAPANKTISPYSIYAYIDGTNKFSPPNLQYTWDEPASDNVPRLRMRATAVYHYKSAGYNAQNPTPIACVSSFYVPTNSTTAQNISTFAGKTIPGGVANGRSNNGIAYPAPNPNINTYLTALTYQSKLKYPNGSSIDDGLLARSLAKAAANRTLSEQSAIDAQLCALQILDGSLTPTNAVIPHGAIKETTLLDSREVQQNSITPADITYDLPLRDRQPIEIRATVLDLGVLSKQTIGGASPTQEYLLPTSGLVYATRDDALPDKSNASLDKSPVDYRLDPKRRPNAIMLVNGQDLGHRVANDYRETEKGFILATNLPAYIEGNFNLHTQEEFTQPLDDFWGNFYGRTTLNPNFACRTNDPRLPACTVGDRWRPASVLADSVTLLSGSFVEGFRDQGDYDWSQKPLTSVPFGFSRFNNFVTQADWPDKITGRPKGLVGTDNFFSSYLNNFVTPIVLRAKPGGYLTEACVVPTGQTEATYCSNPQNWRIQTGNSCNDVGPKNSNPQYLHDSIIGDTSGITSNQVGNKWKTGFIFETDQEVKDKDTGNGNCFSGSNVVRRIAFLRNLDGTLVQPLQAYASAEGNGSVGEIQVFNFGSDKSTNNLNLQDLPNNLSPSMPWLKLPANGDITQLAPVLQIRQPFARPSDPNNNENVTAGKNGNWLQPASDTTFNVIVAAGDSPARLTEDNGGLHNFVRFIQHWNTVTQAKARITGAFIQVKKSAYATGPFTTAFSNGANNELIYAIDINGGRGTGYIPPVRQWGYDVALLSQAPDLFAQKLVLTPPDLPDEYFREVGRDDKWVDTLLCAKNVGNNGNATDYAIPDAKQRPSICKS